MQRPLRDQELGDRDNQQVLSRESLARILAMRTVWLAVCLGVLAGGSRSTMGAERGESGSANQDSRVRLVVDFGDGMQKVYTQLEWKNDWTVWSALDAASRHERGIQVTHRGRDATLLVESIDGVKNEAGRDGRNWIFRVNGEIGDRSAGIYRVKPGDTVLWKFETYR